MHDHEKWWKKHGQKPSWYHACHEIITQKDAPKISPPRGSWVQPIGGLGVATSISCILSFCGGASCADFRFDFDAF